MIIIDKGRLVADDKAKVLRSGKLQREALEIEFGQDVRADLLLNIPGVLLAENKQGDQWILAHDASVDIRPAVFQFAVDHQLQVLGMQKSERALEDVFKELTRPKSLIDGGALRTFVAPSDPSHLDPECALGIDRSKLPDA
ncbi:MAG: hypothetical protein IPI72_12135 [Flavobacteriales bacterium]|nr:hypothetical protein [Flavobacteriales bacterium]